MPVHLKDALISCIVPVYNGELYLEETLDSILAQTYRPMEVIVVDDGSTDGTAAIVRQYGVKVCYFRQANAGPAAARNRGLDEAQGDFIAFLDADDLWHPEKLTRQMAQFEAHPKLDFCVTYIQNFWVPELQEEAERLRDDRLAQPQPGYLLPTLLVRRSSFEAVGRFNVELRLGEDMDWFLRAGELKPVTELLTDVLVYRRLHLANISRSNKVLNRDAQTRVIKLSLDRRRRDATTIRPMEFPKSD